jgi:hypothetical protein
MKYYGRRPQWIVSMICIKLLRCKNYFLPTLWDLIITLVLENARHNMIWHKVALSVPF